jgi:pimeloyl-ACP methyl ester carboxylesterase
MNKLTGFLLAILFSAGFANAQKEPPVEIIASQFMPLTTAHGAGQLPIDLSLDWDKPQPQVERAVIIFHGKGRDVDGYYRGLRKAAELAGGNATARSILIAPQFLNEEDARAHHLPGVVLRWPEGTWEAGREAAGPAAISAYEVIDALVAHLADRKLFPNLKTIVLAGHSGGGQAMQRYAIVGHAEAAAGAGIHVRYVIANPSSYMYFTDDRPVFDGSKVSFASGSEAACHNFNHWKFGPLDPREAYVRDSAAPGWQTLEDAFVQKDVTYLLGTADIDPHEKDLDVTCAGEAQGPTRFLRGQAYYAYLHAHHKAAWNQRLWFVPGVAHSGSKMFDSECGVASLFEQSSCPNQE